MHIFEAAEFMVASKSSRWVDQVFTLSLLGSQVKVLGLWQYVLVHFEDPLGF